jgi:hypothetical protein
VAIARNAAGKEVGPSGRVRDQVALGSVTLSRELLNLVRQTLHLERDLE